MSFFKKVQIVSGFVIASGIIISILGAPVFGVILTVCGIAMCAFSIYRLHKSTFEPF